jgi:uncharacterized protein DUF3293
MDYNSNKIDQSLLKAYNETIYSTLNPSLEIKIGQKNEDLSVFLFDNNAFTWAFVSACNPFSIKIEDNENQKRHQVLIEFTKNREYRFLEGQGKHPNSDWSERSLLILDISKKDAIQLAKDFQQNAIVFGYFNRAPELIICK